MLPNKPMGFPGFKNDQHLGCAMGGTTISGNPHFGRPRFLALLFFFGWIFFPQIREKKTTPSKVLNKFDGKDLVFSREFVLVFVFCIEVH